MTESRAQGVFYDQVYIPAPQSTITLNASTSSDLEFVSQAGWFNLSKSFINFDLVIGTFTTSSGFDTAVMMQYLTRNVPIMFSQIKMSYNGKRLHDCQFQAYWNVMTQNLRKDKSTMSKNFYIKRDSTKTCTGAYTGFSNALAGFQVITNAAGQNLTIPQGVVTNGTVINSTSLLQKEIDLKNTCDLFSKNNYESRYQYINTGGTITYDEPIPYNMFPTEQLRQFAPLGDPQVVAANAATAVVTVNMSICLKDLLPYSICEEDVNLYFRNGLVISFIIDAHQNWIYPIQLSSGNLNFTQNANVSPYVSASQQSHQSPFQTFLYCPWNNAYTGGGENMNAAVAAPTIQMQNIQMVMAVPRQQEQRVLAPLDYNWTWFLQQVSDGGSTAGSATGNISFSQRWSPYAGGQQHVIDFISVFYNQFQRIIDTSAGGTTAYTNYFIDKYNNALREEMNPFTVALKSSGTSQPIFDGVLGQIKINIDNQQTLPLTSNVKNQTFLNFISLHWPQNRDKKSVNEIEQSMFQNGIIPIKYYDKNESQSRDCQTEQSIVWQSAYDTSNTSIYPYTAASYAGYTYNSSCFAILAQVFRKHLAYDEFGEMIIQ